MEHNCTYVPCIWLCLMCLVVFDVLGSVWCVCLYLLCLVVYDIFGCVWLYLMCFVLYDTCGCVTAVFMLATIFICSGFDLKAIVERYQVGTSIETIYNEPFMLLFPLWNPYTEWNLVNVRMEYSAGHNHRSDILHHAVWVADLTFFIIKSLSGK